MEILALTLICLMSGVLCASVDKIFSAPGLMRTRNRPRSKMASVFRLGAALPSLMAVLFLFSHAAQAQFIPGTGDVTCSGPNPYSPNCVDVNYTAVPNDINGGLPQYYDVVTAGFGGYAGFTPTGINTWDTTGNDTQEYAGCQYTSNCPVFEWRVFFDAPVGETAITLSGDVAANGPVAVAVDGLGAYIAGTVSTAASTPILCTLGGGSPGTACSFAVNTPIITSVPMNCDGVVCQNFLDFVFTGCVDWPSCSASYDTDVPEPLLEPVSELYDDPSWVTAPPGTPLEPISESVLLANGGAAPSAIPEPSSLILLAGGLAGVHIRKRQRKPSAAAHGVLA